MNKVAAILILCFFVVSKIFSQETLVTYDFKNPAALQGILPFDQAFRFHFSNIDSPEVNSITVTLYQMDITNYQRLIREYRRKHPLRRGSISLSNNDVLMANRHPVLNPDTLMRGRDFLGREAFMNSSLTLKPNEKYFMEIKQHRIDALNKDEKKELLNEIKKDPETGSSINEFAENQIDHPSDPLDKLNDIISEKLVQVSKEIIQRVNINYQLAEVDRSKLIDSLAECFITLDNFVLGLSSDEQLFLKFSKEPDTAKKMEVSRALIEFNKSIIAHLKEIDWMKVNENDETVKEIDNLVSKYFEKIDASEKLPFAATEKAQLHDLFHKAIKGIAASISVVIENLFVKRVYKDFVLNETYPKEFVKQAEQFITSDLGLAYVWGIGRVNPYVAIHISPSPLNDSTPLVQYSGLSGFLRSRFSFMIGMSLDATIAKDSVRRGVIGSQALILGGGFRVWTWFRINAGCYMYYREPVNPLPARDRLNFTASPFLSISINIKVQSLLKGVGTSIFKTPSQ